MIELRTENFEFTLVPEIGGSIAGLRWRHPEGNWIDLLRPMSEMSIVAKDSLGSSCFPLFPYSNRVRGGKFAFAGKPYELPINVPEPHSQHGHGWQRPWPIVSKDAKSAKIGFDHDPAHDHTWPFAYEAWQEFSIADQQVTITIGARNLDQRTMPIGIGLHPYFLRTPSCRLKADVTGFWETDSEVMPTLHHDVPAQFDLRTGLAMQNVVIDNLFTGFRGQASITWLEFGTRLTVRTSPPLSYLVVYAPDQATVAAEAKLGIPSYFCAEPVSNITDAFNLANLRPTLDTGLIALSKGEEVTALVSLSPEPL